MHSRVLFLSFSVCTGNVLKGESKGDEVMQLSLIGIMQQGPIKHSFPSGKHWLVCFRILTCADIALHIEKRQIGFSLCHLICMVKPTRSHLKDEDGCLPTSYLIT